MIKAPLCRLAACRAEELLDVDADNAWTYHRTANSFAEYGDDAGAGIAAQYISQHL